MKMEHASISAHFTVEEIEQIMHDALSAGARLINGGPENDLNG